MKAKSINFRFLALMIALAAILLVAGWHRIDIEMDIVKSLPSDHPTISDAAQIFLHHPIQDQVTIDIGIARPDPDRLVALAREVETKLRKSDLFTEVGTEKLQQRIPRLFQSTLDRLPDLFSARDLEQSVAPRLAPDAVQARFKAFRDKLFSMDGIGMAEAFSRDPLGLSEPVLSRLHLLAPTENGRIHHGRLISGDGRHTLVMAHPDGSGTDTALARRLTALMREVQNDLNQGIAQKERVVLTPVGAFRAALDNETIVRKDVQKAVVLATVGIALLLLAAFPRPLIGLFSLVPALMGTAAAFFVFSLLHRSISGMVLGFGGAIISITVDHGIAYLLFLDQPRETSGREASREVWAVGLLAALTTMGAFGALIFSGFPVLSQLGEFTALGVFFAFVFVHSIFPRIFPAMPAAANRRLPLQRVVERLADTGKAGAAVAAAVFVILLAFAKPVFNVNLSAMNTVSESTRSAEALMTSVWGNVFNRIFLMTEGDSLRQIQEKGDRLLKMMEEGKGDIAGFIPSAIFPGPGRLAENRRSWKAFWTPERVRNLERALTAAAEENGFSAQAFRPFLSSLTHPQETVPGGESIPEEFFELLGIRAGSGPQIWYQFTGLTTASLDAARHWYPRLKSIGRVFEPTLFSQALGDLLFSTFAKMLGIIALAVIALLFFFFMDLRLTAVALLPILFALVCTLGTLKLIGHPLDIPALMLGIVVVGMGIDYTLFTIRAHQRYIDPNHPSFALVRMAVFMAAASTLIGFGVLCTAEHSLLKSAGLTSFLGIGYSLIGALVILPPILQRIFAPKSPRSHSADIETRVRERYRNMEAYPRLFARFKIKCDPMFAELPDLLRGIDPPKQILDIGTGYGVPACWVLEKFPEARLVGIEPSSERVQVASRALGEAGRVVRAGAPDLPAVNPPADLAFMLDMVHYLSDPDLHRTLEGISARLLPESPMILRAALPDQKGWAWLWRWENFKLRLQGIEHHYRKAETIARQMTAAGLTVERILPSGNDRDLAWIIARRNGGQP